MPFKEKILIVSDFDGTFYSKKLCQNHILSSKEHEYKLIARLNSQLGHTPEEVKNNILTKAKELEISSSQAILMVLTYEQWKIIRLVTTWYDELKFDGKEILASLPANCSFAIASHTSKSLINIAFEMKANIFPIYGPEELQACKPDIKFFENICLKERVSPNQCIYIGDTLKYDILPAIKAGYLGAILTKGEALKVIKMLGLWLKQEESFAEFSAKIKKQSWQNLSLQLNLEKEKKISDALTNVSEQFKLKF